VDLSAYGEITSVVVERDGEIVLEHYGDGGRETLRNTRSCTKTVLSLLIGIAIEQGVVPDVDVTVGELLGRDCAIRVEELLTMTSCLDCNDWDDDSPGNEELMYPKDDWVEFALGLPRRETRSFSYCTAGVVLLGAAVERALGEPLTEFARRELFEPIGIERFEWPQTPRGQTSCAGGLELRSRDLVALGRLVLPGRRSPVPRSWLDESTRPHTRINEEIEYGYLWWIRPSRGYQSIFMTGAGGNRVHVFPEIDTVAVITTHNFARRDAHALSDALVEDLLSRTVN